MEAGGESGIHTFSSAATNARRIEAGLLFSGTDFESRVNPFATGFGPMVDFRKSDFIGMDALKKADRSRLTWGLKCPDGVPRHGDTICADGSPAGRVCSSAWSPFLHQGIAIVRLNDPQPGPGTRLSIECTDGRRHNGEVCQLPMYDPAGDIPRGKNTEIPPLPVGS